MIKNISRFEISRVDKASHARLSRAQIIEQLKKDGDAERDIMNR